MIRRVGLTLITLVSLIGIGYGQQTPASADPHEDPAVQNSPNGKKDTGQVVTVPGSPRTKSGTGAASKSKKTSAIAKVPPAKPVEAEEAILGTWTLALDKSKFNPGPPPQSEVRTYIQTPEGIVGTVTTAGPDGSLRTVSYPWRADGKEHPVAGSELLDTIKLERVDNLTAEADLKHGDKILASERRTLAEDGKTMTITVKDMTSEDRPIIVTAVYEKK